MKGLRRSNKLFAVITSILMLVQSFLPIFPLITPQVFAQEATPTETQTPIPEPTTEQSSPTPADDIQPTPTEESTPAPSATTTPIVTPDTTPTTTPTNSATPAPEGQNQALQQSDNEPPKETGPPAEDGQILDGISTEATPSTHTPEQEEEGILHASVLQNVEAVSLDLDNIDPSNSATLSTDKADYAPTDTAIITGTDFTPGETYNLTISSDDPPPTSTTVQVSADENGNFVYAYQLDGIYRPNYLVEAQELDGATIDTVTFTDSVFIISASGGTNIPSNKAVNGSSPAFTILGDIVITEGLGNDFIGNQTNATLILTVPSGWNFNPGVASVSHQNGRNITNSEILVSSTTATITFSTENATNKTDVLTISGLQIQATDNSVIPGSGNILRTSGNPGTGLITGIVNDDTNFGSLSQATNATPTPAPSSIVQTAIGQCVEEAYGTNVTCTANDVSIANVTNIQILDDGCTSPDDTVTFTATWNVQSTATERYNIGLYFASQGQVSAMNGTCAVSTLANAPVPPNYNFDGNACGDISSASSVNPEITMTVQCLDTDGDNFLNLPYCTSWNQNVGENLSCSGPANAIPGSPSKCNCQNGFEVPVTVPHFAHIEVVKNLLPADDTGTFNLTVNNATEASCIGDTRTTGKVSVTAGTNQNPGDTHTVGETMCNGTDSADYTSAISCVDRGLTTFNGGISLTANGTGPLNVPVSKDDDVLCTITNTRINNASLTIIKDAQPNDGQDFSFTTTGAGLAPFTLDDDTDITLSNTKIFTDLTAGVYSVSETPVSGWALTSAVCSDGSDVNAITLSSGENVTCTFTNTKQFANLTLIKTVTNNNGGTAIPADWTLTATGPTTISGTSGSTTVTSASVEGGSYTLSETNGPTGYTAGAWSCVKNGGNPASGSSITLAPNDTATCTINNDDTAPTLKLTKTVTNDNGGISVPADWNLTATGSAASFTDAGNSATFHPVHAGVTYTLSESGPAGYTAGNWLCTDGIQNGDQITLTLGQNTTCTINNDDIAPTLKLQKSVTNDNGGTATANNWTLTATGTGGFSDAGDSTTFHAVRANTTYTLSESTIAGYTAGSWNCNGGILQGSSLTLGLDEDVTCTITNDDDAPSLTLVKEVINRDGGTSSPSAWTLTASGPAGFSGAGPTASSGASFDAGTYDLSESGPAGYTPSAWVCTGGTQTDSDTVVVGLGHQVICTITNDDIAPTLKLVKIVTNNNGGNETAGDWTLTATGTGGFSDDGDSDTFHPVLANVGYVLSESTIAGYTAGSWSCTGGTLAGNTVTLDLDEDVACTITNDDDAPTITLIKSVINNNGGSAGADDFGLTVGGADVLSGASTPINANTPIALNETGLTGYDFVSITGDNACPDVLGGTVTLDEGEDITCTITNDDKPAHLIVIKHVDNQSVGSAVASDFTMSISGVTAAGGNSFAGTESPGTDKTLTTVGSYGVSETGPAGYTGTYSDDCSGTIALGETKTCTVTNTRDTGTITVNKSLSPNDDPGVFSLQIDGVTAGTGANVGHNGTTGAITVGSGNHTTGEIAGTATALSDYTTTYNCTEGERTIASGQATTSATLAVSKNQDIICTFTNTRKTGDILVHKLLRSDVDGSFVSADPGAFTWGTGALDTPYAMGSSQTFNTGAYDIYENTVSGYHFVGWFEGNPEENDYSCVNLPDNQANSELPVSVTVAYDQQTEITLCNARDTGELKVNKVADTNGDGTYDTTNPASFLWGTVSAESAANSMGASRSFITGNYSVYENTVPGYEFTGWFPGEPGENRYSCAELPEGETYTSMPTGISVTKDQTYELTLCNKQLNPILTITKTNDASGDKSPGDSVLFTMTIAATQSAAHNVIVTDLPAAGFSYRAGSWTSHNSNGTDLKANGTTTEPTYHSPGIWKLGDIAVGETVTLTYIADISADQKPGLYKDLAWAYGCKYETDCSVNDGNDVIALAVSPGYIEEINYVGTHVTIAKSTQNGATLNPEIGEVLGASTELPATGADEVWMHIAALMFLLGIGLITAGKYARRLHV